jgi:hypothetical protein
MATTREYGVPLALLILWVILGVALFERGWGYVEFLLFAGVAVWSLLYVVEIWNSWGLGQPVVRNLLRVKYASWSFRPGASLERVVERLAAGTRASETKAAAFEALRLLGPRAKAASPALLEILRDESCFLLDRVAAARALWRIAPEPEVIAQLTGMLKGWGASYAIDALGEIGPAAQSAIPVLLEIARGGDAVLAGRAGEALARIDPSAAGHARA